MKSNLSRTERAFKRREAFLDIHGKSRMIEIRLLYLMWKNKDYEKLGFDSFKAFLEAPRDSGGLDISREWAVQLIETYRKFIIELGQPESLLIDASPRKLYFLKKKATKDNIEDIISKAKNMSLLDLQRDSKGINESTCHHSWVQWGRCAKCYIWQKK